MQLTDPLPYAIPFFVLAIIFEAIWTHHRRNHEYQANDALTCIATGIMSALTGLLAFGITSFCYVFIFDRFRLFEMREFSTTLQIASLFSLIIAQDFAYYWFHRFAHRVNVAWAGHIVHHSSEAYNLAVAVRQSSFQQFFSWPFYLPCALLGFPPNWLVFVISLNLIYQFWFHTREIDKMANWFEYVFNTPSHHRVHHGTNRQYIDKNYGGIFIIWDRWFGTFEPEIETVRYGISTRLESFNPIWVNVHYFYDLWEKGRKAPNLLQAVRLWFSPPNFKPSWLAKNSILASKSRKISQ